PDSLPITTSQVVAHTISISTMAQRKRGTQEAAMGDWIGVLIGIVSSSLGGTGAAVTRFLAADADPLTIVILRWGIGFLCVLPIALLLRVRWPPRKDWLAVAVLGICFFG